jgi:hypothetical protein
VHGGGLASLPIALEKVDRIPHRMRVIHYLMDQCLWDALLKNNLQQQCMWDALLENNLHYRMDQCMWGALLENKDGALDHVWPWSGYAMDYSHGMWHVFVNHRLWTIGSCVAIEWTSNVI